MSAPPARKSSVRFDSSTSTSLQAIDAARQHIGSAGSRGGSSRGNSRGGGVTWADKDLNEAGNGDEGWGYDEGTASGDYNAGADEVEAEEPPPEPPAETKESLPSVVPSPTKRDPVSSRPVVSGSETVSQITKHGWLLVWSPDRADTETPNYDYYKVNTKPTERSQQASIATSILTPNPAPRAAVLRAGLRQVVLQGVCDRTNDERHDGRGRAPRHELLRPDPARQKASDNLIPALCEAVRDGAGHDPRQHVRERASERFSPAKAALATPLAPPPLTPPFSPPPSQPPLSPFLNSRSYFTFKLQTISKPVSGYGPQVNTMDLAATSRAEVRAWIKALGSSVVNLASLPTVTGRIHKASRHKVKQSTTAKRLVVHHKAEQKWARRPTLEDLSDKVTEKEKKVDKIAVDSIALHPTDQRWKLSANNFSKTPARPKTCTAAETIPDYIIKAVCACASETQPW